MAHRILNHLILVNRDASIIKISLLIVTNRSPDKEIEHDEQCKDENDSIHCRSCSGDHNGR